MKLPHMDRRIIVVDRNSDPPRALTNCLFCNRLTNELDELALVCPPCDRLWRTNHARNYVLPF